MEGKLKTPEEILSEKILPAFQAHKDSPTDEGLASTAAAQISNSIEWNYHFFEDNDQTQLEGATDLKQFRDQAFSQCPELQCMSDLALADKHRRLDRPTAIITTATAAYSEVDGVLTLPDFDDREFDDVAETAIEYLKTWTSE